LRRRIFGTECEYAPVYLQRRPGPEDNQRVDDLLGRQKQIAACLMTGTGNLDIPRAGEFLGNGGRLYVDRGGHPEYATPECTSIAALVAHEIAGDRMVRDLAAAMNAQDDCRDLHILKNNVDLYGHTYGGHENYLITAQGMADISRLVPFLVTRQIFTGAGKAQTFELDGVFGFQISQRADFFDCTYSDRTSEVRGIINIRKREITHLDQDRRLHLIIGDSNMCQYTIGLKIGTAILMLPLLEAGELDDDFELHSPADALKAVSRNLDAKIKVQHRGRCMALTALEIQSACLEKALQFYAVHPPTPEEAQWLVIWEQILTGLGGLKICQPEMVLERDPFDLKRKIDWILKLWLLDRSRSKGAAERQLKRLDLKYHDLDSASGLYEHCFALDLVDRVIPDGSIESARCDPPQDTRAHLRGLVVQQALQSNLDVEVENWERIRIRARVSEPGAQHSFNRFKREVNSLGIDLKDPFQSEDPRMMENLQQFIERWGCPNAG